MSKPELPKWYYGTAFLVGLAGAGCLIVASLQPSRSGLKPVPLGGEIALAGAGRYYLYHMGQNTGAASEFEPELDSSGALLYPRGLLCRITQKETGRVILPTRIVSTIFGTGGEGSGGVWTYVPEIEISQPGVYRFSREFASGKEDPYAWYLIGGRSNPIWYYGGIVLGLLLMVVSFQMFSGFVGWKIVQALDLPG